MKYFLDTSAFVKIYHPEDGTDEILDIYRGEAPILISDLTRIEFLSAIHRKFREREIGADVLEAELERCAKAGRLPKAMAPTDLYGQPCCIDQVVAICDRYGVLVVCDSAEAVGAWVRGYGKTV